MIAETTELQNYFNILYIEIKRDDISFTNLLYENDFNLIFIGIYASLLLVTFCNSTQIALTFGME